jgi:hypothetical protein
VLSKDSGCYVDIERSDAFIQRHTNATERFHFKALPDVLDAAAHFNHHLLRHNYDIEFARKVRMELYLLTTSVDGHRVPNLDVGDFFKDGSETKLLFDERNEYGFTIVNDSDHDVYPYLFYFDPSDDRINVCLPILMHHFGTTG